MTKVYIVRHAEAEGNMNQVERIREMEQCLRRSRKAIQDLSLALEAYQAEQGSFQKLSDYYGSALWMQDYEDDEAGKLPQDLMRGVLSQDEVYNLVAEHQELMEQMQKIVTNSMEDKPK